MQASRLRCTSAKANSTTSLAVEGLNLNSEIEDSFSSSSSSFVLENPDVSQSK